MLGLLSRFFSTCPHTRLNLVFRDGRRNGGAPPGRRSRSHRAPGGQDGSGHRVAGPLQGASDLGDVAGFADDAAAPQNCLEHLRAWPRRQMRNRRAAVAERHFVLDGASPHGGRSGDEERRHSPGARLGPPGRLPHPERRCATARSSRSRAVIYQVARRKLPLRAAETGRIAGRAPVGAPARARAARGPSERRDPRGARRSHAAAPRAVHRGLSTGGRCSYKPGLSEGQPGRRAAPGSASLRAPP